ncbi:hypothetical protein Aperf_G00000024411 [Anoplocephala perfoliata]
MAVGHLKNLRGANNIPDNCHKESFLTDQELRHLILEAADGFLFVSQCDTGRIVYVSDSVSSVLYCSQSDWYQSTLYDLCHPADIEKIREQLIGVQRVSSCAVFGFNTSSESSPNGTNRHSASENSNIGTTSRTLDLKSGMIKREGPKSRTGISDDRRGFLCRMKLGTLLIAPPPSASAMARLNRLRHQQVVLSAADSFNGEAEDFSTAPQQSYALMHVTGFIKHASSSLEAPLTVNEDGYSVPRSVTNFVVSLLDHSKTESVNGSSDNGGTPVGIASGPVYFVGLARLHLTNLPNAVDLSAHPYHEFAVRLGEDKRVYFCDQRIANVFTPTSDPTALQKGLLGEPFTELIVRDDERSRFCTLFEQVWNTNGQKFEIDLHLRPPSTSSSPKSSTSPPMAQQDIVPVKCTLSAFVNPYSAKINYIVGYVRRLQAVSGGADAPTVPYPTTFTSADPGHQLVQQSIQDQNGAYWSGHMNCSKLQPQRSYVPDNPVPNPLQYDFGAASTGPGTAPVDDSYTGKLGEGHSMNSYLPQSQPVAHQSYLSATSPYVQTQPQPPQSTPVPAYTTPSVYSPASDPLEGGVNRTSTIAYLPIAGEQRNGDWHHLETSLPLTSYHQSSYLHYLDVVPPASNSLPSVSANPSAITNPPPTYNAL